MPTPSETVAGIVAAATLDERVALIRLIPQHHGTGDHQAIFAAVAKQLYAPYLAPDFAYVPELPFYELQHFQEAYSQAVASTDDFTRVTRPDLEAVLLKQPRTLLVFRTILGLTKGEFAHSTGLAGEPLDLPAVAVSKVDAMEKTGSTASPAQAQVIAETISRVMAGDLFGDPPGDVKSKQRKPDTSEGWSTVAHLAAHGVPYSWLLHQRHYGGAFRQVLDAGSEKRGNIIEDAVEALFREAAIPYIRTGSHSQGDIAAQFGIQVLPAPDFVVHDNTGTLRAMLECKGAGDGGTARDKALRFERLRAESIRLGGVPLLAVLGGLGWQRANDTLGPVVRDTDGRVFTLATLPEMLHVSPFPTLRGLATPEPDMTEPDEVLSAPAGPRDEPRNPDQPTNSA